MTKIIPVIAIAIGISARIDLSFGAGNQGGLAAEEEYDFEFKQFDYPKFNKYYLYLPQTMRYFVFLENFQLIRNDIQIYRS